MSFIDNSFLEELTGYDGVMYKSEIDQVIFESKLLFLAQKHNDFAADTIPLYYGFDNGNRKSEKRVGELLKKRGRIKNFTSPAVINTILFYFFYLRLEMNKCSDFFNQHLIYKKI